jgi:polyisoprenoid-binding protein YceI
MKKTILIVAAIVILAGVGVVGYRVLRPPAEASQPISAAPLATQAPGGAYPAEASAPQTEAAYPASQEVSPASSASSEILLFQIVPAESSVRFIIDEILNGAPKTVIGETDQVAGQIEVNFSEPAASRVGQIQVNARTLTTDSSFRNRAINNAILQTDTYEFISFNPTSLSGLPASAAVGDTFTFQVSGDLTIRDITQSVTFEVEVTVVSETRLSGKASAVIQRADYKLVIPEVPSVAGVDEAVKLEIDFTASR